ncbi:DNA polymerase family B-domain-containing protein [Chytriomyces cf. hyalinus JEL632]|nr:DNA polymerase family B-domain-containing protein [Chytriomyces cf. hyalinus JEL632]
MNLNQEGAVTAEFQVFSYHMDDGPQDTQFTAHLFGKTMQGESVVAHVTGYTPSFCVLFDEDISTEEHLELLYPVLQKQLIQWTYDADQNEFRVVCDDSDQIDMDASGIIEKIPFWGFQFSRKCPFFKFAFASNRAYKKLLSLFRMCHQNTLDIDEMTDLYEQFVEKKWDRTAVTELAAKFGVSERLVKWVGKLGAADLDLRFASGKLYEVIDPLLRFVHLRQLKVAGWLSVKGSRRRAGATTTCAIELDIDYSELQPLDRDDISRGLTEMAFDIESYSWDDKFPDPNEPRNCVYQIGITLKTYSVAVYDRVLLHCRTPENLRPLGVSGSCATIPSIRVCRQSGKQECPLEHVCDMVEVFTHVFNYDNESDLLLAFRDFILNRDPDIIYGYNSDTFDWNYLFIRAKVVGIERAFARISRFTEFDCVVDESKFQSAAYGDNRYFRVDIPGRLNVDLLIWIQRNMPADRYPDYKLDTVAEKEIQENKRDVDHLAIFAAFRSGDPDELALIGDYCCQDTVLVQKLVDKLDVVTQMFEMANITDTPPSYLLQKDFLIPLADSREAGKFKGAIVLEPETGYYNTPIAVLDFASLYPSIQVAYNVCYTTIVLDSRLKNTLSNLREQGKELVVDGVRFDTIEWEEDMILHVPTSTLYANVDDAKGVEPKKVILASLQNKTGNWTIARKSYSYAYAQNQPSIIPTLQVKLKKSRKLVKRMMAPLEHSSEIEDQLRYRVLNGRQLAIKVSMNSIYGFTSAFMLNLTALGACVTAKGRQMIEQTRNFMETRFQHVVQNRHWSLKDETTFYTADGKETLIPIGSPVPAGCFRKFPIAKAGEPWSRTGVVVKVVGGDTDSVFCHFPESSVVETLSLCYKAAEVLTAEVFNRSPIEMEYEKVYCPMVIQKKKNYIGVKYETDDQRWKIDYKGIAIKRRNYCTFVKDTFWAVIYPVLGLELIPGTSKYRKITHDQHQFADLAVQILERQLQRLMNGEVALDDLVMSASLKSGYKGKECGDGCSGKTCVVCDGTGVIVNLPHVQLARRMKQRDAGSAPVSGQRFGFVVVDDPDRGTELSAKSECPVYAKQHNLDPDLLYYLNQQLARAAKEEAHVFAEAAKREFFSGRGGVGVGGGAGGSGIKPLKALKRKKTDAGKSSKRITDFFAKGGDAVGEVKW